VAHEFTTHYVASVADYFTPVDTIMGVDEDSGAGLINETELTSGVFYTYAVLDMEQLRGNLGAEADKAEQLASNLVRVMTTVSPGAKRGSTAPFAYAEMVLLERGPQQPRTLANAFLEPVSSSGVAQMPASVKKLFGYRSSLEEMYEPFEGVQAISTIHAKELPEGSPESRPLRDTLGAIFHVEG
jgi:CRISPR system Cascade subunit CasC